MRVTGSTHHTLHFLLRSCVPLSHKGNQWHNETSWLTGYMLREELLRNLQNLLSLSHIWTAFSPLFLLSRPCYKFSLVRREEVRSPRQCLCRISELPVCLHLAGPVWRPRSSKEEQDCWIWLEIRGFVLRSAWEYSVYGGGSEALIVLL